MTHLVAVGGSDADPNFSICGIPYWISGDVEGIGDLAHRTFEDLQKAGMAMRAWTFAHDETISYDKPIIGAGASPALPPNIACRGPGVGALHSMKTSAWSRPAPRTTPSDQFFSSARSKSA